MKKAAYFSSFGFAALLAAVSGFHYVFEISQPAPLLLTSSHHLQSSSACYHHPQTNSVDKQLKAVDHKGQLNLLVWNIYKQNRANWQTALSALAQDKQLILLQEASMTPEFAHWLAKKDRVSYQVEAFKAFGVANGVLNLSLNPANEVCALTQLEPWLRLPKSALYALYPLSTGESLAVVNLHAVNFSYGTQEYQQQLNALAKRLAQHQGPMIVAGDFNSWSETRLSLVAQMAKSLGLKEVEYRQDQRLTFITGLPLDHVFYRGLLAEKAETPLSDASDHNPIMVSFRLMPSSNSHDQNIQRPN